MEFGDDGLDAGEAIGDMLADRGASARERGGWTWIAEAGAAFLGGGQGFLGALADLLPLMFGEGGEHVEHELVSVRIIHRHELDATFHEVGNEGDIARQTVELGDDQPGFLFLADGECSGELGPVVFLTAFDFGELGDKLAVAGDMGRDRRALGIEAQATLALTVGRNTVVGDEFLCHAKYCNGRYRFLQPDGYRRLV